MRNSLLAMLIAFGTTVAMPATAAEKIERHAFQLPETQDQQMRHRQMQNHQMQTDAGKATLAHSTDPRDNQSSAIRNQWPTSADAETCR